VSLAAQWNIPPPPSVITGIMNPLKTFALLFAAAALVLTGCQSVDSRIRENPQLFASLDAQTQAKIRQGIIELGYTHDMVYLALGAPDQKRESRSVNGTTTLWIYSTYYERYDGRHFVGYNRRVYWDPYLRSYRVHYLPVYADAYRPEVEERIRITFENGRVSAIEQTTG
jgi:hypothetical protein